MSRGALTEYRGGFALAGDENGVRWSRYCGPQSTATGRNYMLPADGGHGRKSFRIVYPSRLAAATKRAKWGAQ